MSYKPVDESYLGTLSQSKYTSSHKFSLTELFTFFSALAQLVVAASALLFKSPSLFKGTILKSAFKVFSSVVELLSHCLADFFQSFGNKLN